MPGLQRSQASSVRVHGSPSTLCGRSLLVLATCLAAGCGTAGTPLKPVRAERAAGPLRALAANPRYFTDGSGRAILLTGSHTWANFQDLWAGDTSPHITDYAAYLRFLVAHNHDFFRLWTWEQDGWANWHRGRWRFRPMPYQRTGPDTALDGGPRYDLTKFDPAYFARLRARVQEAGEHGIYVSVMLFDGFSIEDKNAGGDNPWLGHPFNAANNVNGVDGDPHHHGEGKETQTLQVPAITRLQEAYVRQVVDAVNDLDNVLYEICNESHAASKEWQYHVIEYVRRYEASKPKQHPIGMTAYYPGGDNEPLFTGPADWVSPYGPTDYVQDPPPADGRKVVLTDTDHECGTCVPAGWVWKSFARGLNPIFMDPYDRTDVPKLNPRDPRWEQERRDMGNALTYANRMPLALMTPQGDLASSGYCLAHAAPRNPAYLVYLPAGAGSAVTVDLMATPGRLAVEWLSPRSGRAFAADSVDGGARRSFAAPFGGEAVLYLH